MIGLKDVMADKSGLLGPILLPGLINSISRKIKPNHFTRFADKLGKSGSRGATTTTNIKNAHSRSNAGPGSLTLHSLKTCFKGGRNSYYTVLGQTVISHQYSSGERDSLFSRAVFS